MIYIHYIGPVVINYITGNTVTFEGNDVTLICNVTNDVNSSLEIMWYHEGELLVDEDHNDLNITNTTNSITGQVQSVLSFIPVRYTHKGEYKCSALNHLKCVAEENTLLTVECKLFCIHNILTMCVCTYNRCTKSFD